MMTMGVTALSGFGILLAAFAATTILRKRSASLRHLVWTVGLGLLVAVPAFHAADLRVEVPVPAAWVASSAEAPPETPVIAMAPESSLAPSAVLAPSETLARDTQARAGSGRNSSTRRGDDSRSGAATGRRDQAGHGTGSAPARSNQVGSAFADEERLPVSGANTVLAGDGFVEDGETDDAASAGLGMTDVLLIIWALGSIVLLTGTLFSHLAARRLVRTGVERASPRAARRFARLCVDLGVRRPARLVVNPRIRVPATWGFRQATVVLPPSYEEWAEETLERVLLHELAHVQRGDCFAAAIGECARAVHWPNPLAWLALSRQRAESEHACDDLVLRAGETPSDYAHDLLRLVRSFSTSAPLPEASLAMARPSGLGRRVRAVLDPAQNRAGTRRSVGMAVGLVAVLTAFGATAVVPVARAQEEPPRAELSDVPQVPDPPAAEPATRWPAEVAPPPTAEPSPDLTDATGRPLRVPVVSRGAEPVPEDRPPAPWAGAAVESGEVAPVPLARSSVSGAGRSWTNRSSRVPGFYPFSVLPPVDQTQELCVFRTEGTRSASVNSDRGQMTIRWETDGCRVDIDIEGDIEYSSDDTQIARMSRGSRFELEERIGSSSRRVRLEGTSSGIERRYWVDGDETEWDQDAVAWMGLVLPELFRHTTINAEARVRRFLAEGGAARVFQEVELIHSDHVTAHYLELLMGETDLREEDYARIIDYAGQLDSDHTSGELLLAVVETAGLRPSFQRPILRAAEGLDSDHQKTRVLQALLESDLGGSQIDAVVESAATIESDHNLAEILTTVARTGRLSDTGRGSFLRALGSIDSDHNKGMVLEAFLDSGRLTDDEVSRVLEMTHGIGSDHQRGMILQRVAAEFPLSGEQVTAYLRSASDLGSDHQMAMTAEAIIDRADFTREHLALVLTMADRIASDHQRGVVLERVVLRQELATAELEEVLMVARGIESDHQLGALLTLILEDETLSPEGVLAVLSATSQLRSSHERTNVLVRLAGIYEMRGAALEAYEEVAEDLGRQDQRRVMDALRG